MSNIQEKEGADACEREECDCWYCLKEDRRTLLAKEEYLESDIRKQKDVIHKLIIDKIEDGFELSPYFESVRNMYSNDLRDAEERFSKAQTVYKQQAADERNKNALLEAEVRHLKDRLEKERYLHILPKPKELLLLKRIYYETKICDCICCLDIGMLISQNEYNYMKLFEEVLY